MNCHIILHFGPPFIQRFAFIANLISSFILFNDSFFELSVALVFTGQTLLKLLGFSFFALEIVLFATVLLTSFFDQDVAKTALLNAVLPAQVKFVAGLMLLLVQFRCLIKFDLLSLSVSDFLLELIADFCYVYGGFFDVSDQLCNLFVIESPVLFKSEIIFFLLSGSEGPLFKFLLVPIHLKFKLVHTFIGFEDHVLDVIQPVLLVSNSLLQFFNFVLETTTLAFGDLLQMLLSFDFLIFSIYETLGMHKLHLDRFQVLIQNLEALLVLLNLQPKLSHQPDFFTDNLV